MARFECEMWSSGVGGGGGRGRGNQLHVTTRYITDDDTPTCGPHVSSVNCMISNNVRNILCSLQLFDSS